MPTSKNWKLLQRQLQSKIEVQFLLVALIETQSSQHVTITLYSKSLEIFLGNFMGSPCRISSPHVKD